MNYVKKLNLALDYRNKNIDSLLLGESVTKQVKIAANLAYALRLTPAMFKRVVNGRITESQLAVAMRQRILLTEAGATRTSTATPTGLDDTSEGPTHDRTASGSSSYDRDANAMAGDPATKKRQTDRDAKSRADSQGQSNRDTKAFDRSGNTMSNVKHFADILTKVIQKVPPADRSKKTQEVVKQLLDAANKMLYDASRHGGKKQKWGVSQKYRPMAREGINFMGNPVLEQIVLEGVVLNELLGKFVKGLKNMFGRGDQTGPYKKPTGKHDNAEGWEDEDDDEGAMADEEVKERGGSPEEIAINGIIDTLKAADISTHGQTTMLQNVIKYVTKAVGTKVEDPAGRKREQIMSDYVDQMLKKQSGKPKMSMAINIGKMDKKMAAEVIETYKKVLAGKGLKISDKTNNRGGVYEFVIIPKDPKAETVGDAAYSAMKAKTSEYIDMDKAGGMAMAKAGGMGAQKINMPPESDEDEEYDDEEEAEEDKPWRNPPEGSQIIGHLIVDGEEDEEQTVATTGKKGYIYIAKVGKWVKIPDESYYELLAGKSLFGGKVKLKTVRDKNPAGSTRDEDQAEEDEPWDTPPKGMHIVGSVTKGGKVDPQRNIASNGTEHVRWSTSNERWIPITAQDIVDLRDGKIKGFGFKWAPGFDPNKQRSK